MGEVVAVRRNFGPARRRPRRRAEDFRSPHVGEMEAQRQYYAGQMDAAMKTSIKLCEYDDILPPRDIYSLLALAAYHNKFYGICSQAFVKLETLPNVPETAVAMMATVARSSIGAACCWCYWCYCADDQSTLASTLISMSCQP